MTAPVSRTSEYRRAYYLRNRDRCISDGKSRYAASRTSRLYDVARRRAEAKGLPFRISLQDLDDAWPIDNRCPVFGVEFSRPQSGERQGPKPHSPTIDRIRPELGYVPGNIVVISWRANRIKYNATPEELTAVARWAAKVTPELF